MHGSCTQYQKQLQEVEEKNAAAQEMQKKLEAELNEVSWGWQTAVQAPIYFYWHVMFLFLYIEICSVQTNWVKAC